MPNGFDWESFLADLYKGGLKGLEYTPPDTSESAGADQLGGYTYSEDVLKMLKKACTERGGTWDKENQTCETGYQAEDVAECEVDAEGNDNCPEGEKCFNGQCIDIGEYDTDFESFMKGFNVGGYCKGGSGNTKDSCEADQGEWVPFYTSSDDEGMFGGGLYQWMQDNFDLPEGYEEYFATLTFPMQDFLDLLGTLPEIEAKETELVTRAYEISENERDRQQSLIDEAYVNGYLSVAERDELIQDAYNLSEQAYQNQVGLEAQKERIESALADGTLTEAEYETLVSQLGEFEGKIFQNMQNAINGAIEKKLQTRIEAGEALTSATEAAQAKYLTGFESAEAQKTIGERRAGLQKEMGELRSRRDFTTSFQNVRGTLLQELPMAREILKSQFAGAGYVESEEDKIYRQTRNNLGRIVGQTFLPALQEIAKAYNVSVKDLSDEYDVRTGALTREYGEWDPDTGEMVSGGRVTKQARRQFDILMGSCSDPEYGTKKDCEANGGTWAEGAIEREFGLDLDDISDTASQAIDTAELAMAGDELARDEALQAQEATRRDIEFRRNQADAGLLTDAEIDQLNKDEALWNIRKAMDERLAGVESFISDWMGSVMDQYGLVKGLDIGVPCEDGEKKCPDGSCIDEDEDCPDDGDGLTCQEKCDEARKECYANNDPSTYGMCDQNYEQCMTSCGNGDGNGDVKRYSCDEAGEKCVEDENGSFENLALCLASGCEPDEIPHNCVDGNCVPAAENSPGQYPSIELCEADCGDGDGGDGGDCREIGCPEDEECVEISPPDHEAIAAGTAGAFRGEYECRPIDKKKDSTDCERCIELAEEAGENPNELCYGEGKPCGSREGPLDDIEEEIDPSCPDCGPIPNVQNIIGEMGEGAGVDAEYRSRLSQWEACCEAEKNKTPCDSWCANQPSEDNKRDYSKWLEMAPAGCSPADCSARYGANFITSGPRNLLVGDNPGGRELVQVTPIGSKNVRGPSLLDQINDTGLSYSFGESSLLKDLYK